MKIYCVFEEVYNWEGSWKNLKSLHLTEREAVEDKQICERMHERVIRFNNAHSSLFFTIEEWSTS